MPYFFFHLHDDAFFPDNRGVELPSINEAFAQAATTAIQILRDVRMETLAGKPWQVEVTDEEGHLLFTLNLSIQLPKPGD